jgi:uncharacterized tellurite resistance protein B-like protein
MFGRWLNHASRGSASEGPGNLESAVRAELKDADQETVAVVTAIAGLLGAVAYADRDFSTEEQLQVRLELGRIQGMTPAGVDAVCAAIRRCVLEIATVETPGYARALRELADHELRFQVLEILVALSAADQTITTAETNVLRQITTSLGLTQQDYNDAQAKFVHRLGVLKERSNAR